MDDLIVTMADVRRAGFCTRGIRRWAHANGLDFADFVKNGIPAARVQQTGDGLALRVLDKIQGGSDGRQ